MLKPLSGRLIGIIILGSLFSIVVALALFFRQETRPPALADTIESPCPEAETPDQWRLAQTIEGIAIEADPSCHPDDPHLVAASVLGTNHSIASLMQTRLARDAIVKGRDLDSDGDPDEIEIRLEVTELNGHSADLETPALQFQIAPGIYPGLWVFSPKTRGMATTDFLSNKAHAVLRLPSPVIRVEQGDEVTIILENSHYFPHTIHLHGIDHPFLQSDGSGNDGVPMVSEMPVLPGQAKRYRLAPRHPGTFFYHCHVQPQTHILMGLAGMIVVEKNQPNNRLQTLNIGAGRVRHRSAASRESYDREFDLHYQEMDHRLHSLIQETDQPALLAKRMNREYKIAERTPNYYLVNGRSFPLSLRESLVVVAPNERIKLRVLNSGASTNYLHPHGHKPTVTHLDGVPLDQPITRDVIAIGPAQRVDLDLITADDGRHSYGQGVWLMHDHHEPAVTTNGINPGGDVSMIVYESHLQSNGMPKTHGSLEMFFDPAYYRGEIPVWGKLLPHLYGDENTQH
ncbi:multicopper oxidase domain-containing protein [Oceanococcus atlanticus]|nr:multicopper oxidase domain-containing protein [Oceanococcus atlanticus]